jgi:hypothetical protein
MDSQMIQKSLQNEELVLSSYQKFNHYGVVAFVLMFPLILIGIFVVGQINGHENKGIGIGVWFIVISCLTGYLFYRIQKRRLKFRSIQTDVKRNVLISSITRFSKERDWKLVKSKGNVIVLKTQPSFLSGSWGEQVTIMFKGNRVLLNSICDLDKWPSIVSMGRNKENVTSLAHHIQNVI